MHNMMLVGFGQGYFQWFFEIPQFIYIPRLILHHVQSVNLEIADFKFTIKTINSS
jgi:hypothetical protein